jgi:hypothetical protein
MEFLFGKTIRTHSEDGGGRRRQTKKRGHIKREMKCSPLLDKFRVSKSCYTPQILESIKRAYNKDHSPEERIRETNPTDVWRALSERLDHCQQEDCWLNQLSDNNLRQKIDRYIFAPDQPYEWKTNPNEWLSNYDILNVIEQYEQTYPRFKFIGPTPIDFDTRLGDSQNPYDTVRHEQVGKGANKKCVWNELCGLSLKDMRSKRKTKIGIIFNLDKHDQGGSHWVSMFIDMSRKVLFYFDSAAGNMPPEIDVLMKRVQAQARELGISLKTYDNLDNPHQSGNTECGVYSLFFIIMMLTGRTTPTSRKMPFKEIMHLFLKGRISDKEIEKYRGEYFNS